MGTHGVQWKGKFELREAPNAPDALPLKWWRGIIAHNHHRGRDPPRVEEISRELERLRRPGLLGD